MFLCVYWSPKPKKLKVGDYCTGALDSNPDLAVAVINGPEAVVVSGPHPALERLTSQLQAEQIGHKALVVSHGFHSPLMEPILEPFHQFASQFSFQPPQLPFVSNRTGTLIPPGQALDATYWTDHIRATVRFHEGLTTAVDSGTNLFLELGPKPVLCGLGQRSFPSLTWIPTLQGPNEPAADGLEALGTLYTCGIDLDWNAFHAQEHRSKIPLPTYAFQRQNYWPENSLIPMTASNVTASNSTHHSTNSTNDSPTPISPMNNQVSARISQEITTMVAKMMRMEPAALDLQTSFLGLGLDSLTLLNVIAQIEKQYGVTLGIHQFLDQLTNLQELIDFLSQIVSEQDVLQPASPQAVVVSPAPQPVAVASNNGNQNGSQNGNQNGSNNGTSNGSSNGASNGPAIVQPLNSLTALDSATSSPLERVIAQQMTLMAKQLEAMQGQGPGQSTVSVAGNTAPIASPTSAPSPTPPTVQPAPAPTAPSATSQSRPAAASTNAPAPFSFWGAKGTAGPTPTPEQQAFIDQLVQDYCQRTQGSKASAAAYRDYLADRRSIRGLRPEIKEMFYPIVAERGKGSRIWDVDGNEYIDITMGFGVHLLGHNPDFINQALQQTLTTGVQVGPQYPLTGEVAQLFSQLTGKERVTFCNSGTEAVMTALRIARAASGKAKIIKFKGAYHGHFDGTLAIPADTNGDPNREPYGEPMFPGTSPAMVQDVIVLDYGKPESLEVIKRHQGELAAVIVEPVQSRLLSLAPQEFLHELRAITKAANVPLIFDEVILGFRAAPGGAQEYFGVEADIATYGKALGGGMPIGVVAGKAQFMDYIDGGTWRYGDQSYPQTDPTYFAGTFCKHPLAMTAAKAVLRHLQTQGGALQAKLNDATARLVGELNRYFQTEGLMLRADQFASIFRIEFQSMFSELYLPLEMDLLFYLLVHKGVYVWEGRVCFLSEAHTDEDIDRIIAVVKESVEDLRAVGYFPAPKNRATNGTGNSVTKDLKKNAVTA
jgi:glutamate-1-semialdehyde aminotransferase/acyl carrier protein